MTRYFLIALIMCTLGSACSSLPPSASRHLSASDPVRERAELHTALALAYLDQGQTEAGRLEAQRALELASEHRDALHALALVALANGDADAARGHFEKAFNAIGGADDFALRLNYARFLCERHDLSAGRALLKNAPEQSAEQALRIQRVLDEKCS